MNKASSTMTLQLLWIRPRLLLNGQRLCTTASKSLSSRSSRSFASTPMPFDDTKRARSKPQYPSRSRMLVPLNKNQFRDSSSSSNNDSSSKDSNTNVTINGDSASMEESPQSSIIDGLTASSTWRKGQLSKINNKFEEVDAYDCDAEITIEKGAFSIDDTRQPLEINNDEDVQQMWKDMESRVTRRKSMTLAEAKFSGRTIGRKNLRKTDEEAWLEAGLYHVGDDDGNSNNSDER